MKTSIFRKIISGIILMTVMYLLLILGFNIGFYGGRGLDLVIFHETKSLVRILYGVMELFTGICFFIMLGKQIFPGGVKDVISGEMTLVNKARYLPMIFALGTFAGLVGNAVFIFDLLHK